MTPPRRGGEGARGRTRTPDARLRKPALCPLSYARWCSLTSSRRDARRPGALGGSRTPVSASVERRRVHWTTKADAFRPRRATNARAGARKRQDKMQQESPVHDGGRTKKAVPENSRNGPSIDDEGQTTGPPEPPAGQEEPRRSAEEGADRRCPRGSTERRSLGWTNSRTVLLLSISDGRVHALRRGGPRKTVRAFLMKHNPISRMAKNSTAQPPGSAAHQRALPRFPHAGRRARRRAAPARPRPSLAGRGRPGLRHRDA